MNRMCVRVYFEMCVSAAEAPCSCFIKNYMQVS